ncbi:hypothetical protein BDW62DRAFT_203697 [Aspergillus aurantiobrunneus]
MRPSVAATPQHPYYTRRKYPNIPRPKTMPKSFTDKLRDMDIKEPRTPKRDQRSDESEAEDEGGGLAMTEPEDSPGKDETDAFMTMREYGPWDTQKVSDMEHLAPILVAIALRAKADVDSEDSP